MKMTIPELDAHIAKHIQGGFGQADMAVLKEEIEKLEPENIHVQIGIDEGRSLRVAHEYAPEGVWIVGIDIHDPVKNPGLSRAEFMEQEGMVGLNKRCFYVHGDADLFTGIFYSNPNPFVKLLFIDGFHGKEDVERDTLKWIHLVKKRGVILYHDIDHPGVLAHLNEYYGEGNWINTNGKIGKVVIK